MTYPRYFEAIVGVAPDKMRRFTADDMMTLCEIFAAVTRVNPLAADQPLRTILGSKLADIQAELTPAPGR